MPGVTYTGTKTVANVLCNSWTSPQPSPDVIYLAVKTNVPVAMELFGSGGHTFMYYYLNWKPGRPNFARYFTLPGGQSCPQSNAETIARSPKCTDKPMRV
jgi:hypothetical protein